MRFPGALGCLIAISVVGAEDSWKLPADAAKYKPGPGVELAIANCALCHSADYISTQPPLNGTAWKAVVEKMRLRYGAPVSTNNVDAIANYLAVAYGTGTNTVR